MSDVLQWMMSGLLAAFFVAANIANLSLLLDKTEREEGKRSSPIVFAGGIAGAIALAIAPYEPFNDYFWVPLLIDLGTGPFLLFFAVIAAYQALSAGAWLRHVPFVRYLIKPEVVPPRAPYPKERAIVGCILGTAVGDAMGLVYEGLSRQRQLRMFSAIEGYRFLCNKGFTSDDTEHTCMLAQALIETGNYHIDYVEKKFVANFAWRLRFWLLGLPAGIGMATLKAILKLWLGFTGRLSGIHSAGNAPAMRSALIGVCYGEDAVKMKLLTRAATRITHVDPDAEHGALAVALAAHLAATCADDILPPEYLRTLQGLIGAETKFATLVRDVCESIARGEGATQYAERIGCGRGVTGYVCHTVPVALHVWLTHQSDYRSAVVTVIRLGGDTDTAAAIVGAIVGARVGKEGIPADWLRDLWEWPRTVQWMETLGTVLALHCAGHSVGGSVPVSLFPLLIRNIFFMVLVLMHGFRRLLPPYGLR